MRVKVDRDLCQGHGVCAEEAPEAFEVDEDSNQVRLLQETPADALRAKVRTAVKYCPTRALSIEEE